MMPSPRLPQRPGRLGSPGRVAVILLAALVLAAIVAAFFLTRSGEAPPDTPAAPNPVARERDLTAFQQALDAAIQKGGDIRPVLKQGAALVKQYPDSAPVRLSYGMALMSTGHAGPAYEQFAEATHLDPSNPETQSLAGALAMQAGKPADALRHLSQAVGLAPANPQYRLQLAAAYDKNDKPDEARAAYLEALRINSSLHEARFGLAELYAGQNKINLALDQIASAVELVPAGDEKQEARRALYLRKQANYLRRDNRPAEALAILQSLPPQARVTSEVCEDLATTWTMLGKPGSAAHHYEQVLILDPTAEWAAEAAANLRLKAGDKEKAAANLATLKRINPRSPRIAEIEHALNR